MLIRLNEYFIIRRILFNKYLLANQKKLLKLERLRCEYRADVQSDHPYEWQDLAIARLLFELLMQTRVHEAEFNNRTGYYNPSDPKSESKKYLPGSKRFAVLFGISTSRRIFNAFFANLYWGTNYHFGSIKREFLREQDDWEQVNMERVEPKRVEKVEAEAEKKEGFISQRRDFKLMTLVDQNEGRERERAAFLALKEPGESSCIVLHCYYFNFAPFLAYGSDEFKRHFAIEFEFDINKKRAKKISTIYDILIFLTSRKLNWVWVEAEIIERFKTNSK